MKTVETPQKSSTFPKLQEAQKCTRKVNWNDRPVKEYIEKHKQSRAIPNRKL